MKGFVNVCSEQVKVKAFVFVVSKWKHSKNPATKVPPSELLRTRYAPRIDVESGVIEVGGHCSGTIKYHLAVRFKCAVLWFVIFDIFSFLKSYHSRSFRRIWWSSACSPVQQSCFAIISRFYNYFLLVDRFEWPYSTTLYSYIYSYSPKTIPEYTVTAQRGIDHGRKVLFLLFMILYFWHLSCVLSRIRWSHSEIILVVISHMLHRSSSSAWSMSIFSELHSGSPQLESIKPPSLLNDHPPTSSEQKWLFPFPRIHWRFNRGSQGTSRSMSGTRISLFKIAANN